MRLSNCETLNFVHNHPSGNPQPSASDKSLTRELVYAGRIIRIRVLDHIIIGNDKYFSFVGEGMIEEYENDFLNLMLRKTVKSRREHYDIRLQAD